MGNRAHGEARKKFFILRSRAFIQIHTISSKIKGYYQVDRVPGFDDINIHPSFNKSRKNERSKNQSDRRHKAGAIRPQ